MIAAACAIFGLAVWLAALFYVVDAIRAADDRRQARRAARRRVKPGPTKREQERALIRAQARVLAEDTARGIVAPLAERRR